MIKLIINADDFGYSKVFNEKILNLLERGFVKSTTVLINYVTDEQKNQVSRLVGLNNTADISVGLHVFFDSKRPMEGQLKEQFDKFKNIFEFNPSHFDFHKGKVDINETERNNKYIEAIDIFARNLNLPVRNYERESLKLTTKHTTRPRFSTVPFDLDKAISFLNELTDGESCEIACHPG